MKNKKLLLDIQTKCSDITNEILNAASDAEQTFKCKWPYFVVWTIKGKPLIEKMQFSSKCWKIF